MKPVRPGFLRDPAHVIRVARTFEPMHQRDHRRVAPLPLLPMAVPQNFRFRIHGKQPFLPPPAAQTSAPTMPPQSSSGAHSSITDAVGNRIPQSPSLHSNGAARAGQVAANGRFRRIVTPHHYSNVYIREATSGVRWPARGNAPQLSPLVRGSRCRESRRFTRLFGRRARPRRSIRRPQRVWPSLRALCRHGPTAF